MKKLRFKKLPNTLLIRLVAVLTFAVGLIFVSILPKQQISNVIIKKVPSRVIEVKVSPIPDEQLSAEERFWKFEKVLNPSLVIPNPIPKGIPHSCGLLFISIENDGQIKLNSENSGNLEDTDDLKNRLETIFRGRTLNRVFEERSDKTVKGVYIIAPSSIKYGDFIKLVDAVKESGADPIVLEIDEYSFKTIQVKNF